MNMILKIKDLLTIDDDGIIRYKGNMVGNLFEEITTWIVGKYGKDLEQVLPEAASTTVSSNKESVLIPVKDDLPAKTPPFIGGWSRWERK